MNLLLTLKVFGIAGGIVLAIWMLDQVAVR